jgi:hypothetical protein
MKIRNGFVSNSSSSSFVISKKDLTTKQIYSINNHIEIAEYLGIKTWESPWDIRENDEFIEGYTYMDNFDMDEFLEKIGVDKSKIDWTEGRMVIKQ